MPDAADRAGAPSMGLTGSYEKKGGAKVVRIQKILKVILATFTEYCVRRGRKSDRSRRVFSSSYLGVEFVVETQENDPFKVLIAELSDHILVRSHTDLFVGNA